MTTNKEALQKIFEAALKEPEPQPTPTTRLRSRTPTEIYPKARSYGEPTPSPTPTPTPTPSPAPAAAPLRAIETVSQETIISDAPTESSTQAGAAKTVIIPTQPTTTNDTASAELIRPPHQKQTKDNDKRKIQQLLLSIVAIGGIGGGILWFIQSPEQAASSQSVISEVQTATETQSMASEGEQSLNEAIALSNKAERASSVFNASSEIEADENSDKDKESTILTGNNSQEK